MFVLRLERNIVKPQISIFLQRRRKTSAATESANALELPHHHPNKRGDWARVPHLWHILPWKPTIWILGEVSHRWLIHLALVLTRSRKNGSAEGGGTHRIARSIMSYWQIHIQLISAELYQLSHMHRTIHGAKSINKINKTMMTRMILYPWKMRSRIRFQPRCAAGKHQQRVLCQADPTRSIRNVQSAIKDLLILRRTFRKWRSCIVLLQPLLIRRIQQHKSRHPFRPYRRHSLLHFKQWCNKQSSNNSSSMK